MKGLVNYFLSDNRICTCIKINNGSTSIKKKKNGLQTSLSVLDRCN